MNSKQVYQILKNKEKRDTIMVRGKIDYLEALFGKYFSEVKKAA